jgi:pimeloyl-ACP methyl ester carboxylesterase
MMTPEFFTFHGSPGTPYDFEPLKRAICQYQWNGFIRYKDEMPLPKDDKSNFNVAVGYSYGASEAILAAASNPNFRAVVLIAPYAFTKAASPIKKLVVALPILGNLLLKGKAQAIIDDFLIKSSHPLPVPEIYRTYGEHLKNPLLLKAAVWEKKDRKELILKACVELNKREVPVLIIWANQDQTGDFEEQVTPFEKNISNLNVKRIENAGHALPYTHYIEVAKSMGAFLKEEIKKTS